MNQETAGSNDRHNQELTRFLKADSFVGAFGNMFSRESALTANTFIPGDYIRAGQTFQSLQDHLDDEYKLVAPPAQVLPWDLFVKHGTGSRPHQIRGCPFDTEPEDHKGAELLAITAAKNTIRLGGATSVSFEAAYVLGVPDFTSVIGGQVTPPTILPIGGGIAFGGGTNPIRTIGFPQWGNGTGSQRVQESFGATNLRAAMYDHWPEEDTIYDTRYFAPLFFCAGSDIYDNVSTILVDSGVTPSEPWVPASGFVKLPNYERTIDQVECNVDFRVPTAADPNSVALDNMPIAAGSLINGYGVGTSEKKEDTILSVRPKEEWRVNPVARGAMISHLHGFRHMRTVIGVSFLKYYIKSPGAGFADGSTVAAINGNEISVVVTADSSGGITAVAPANWGQGEGLQPSDFRNEHTIMLPTVPPSASTVTGYKAEFQGVEGSEPAEIVFALGEVYEKLYETDYPKKHGKTDLVPGSNGENGRVEGSKTTSIGITESNNTNTYDIYYYYTNDVSHVAIRDFGQAPAFSQYVLLDIGAG